MPRSCSPNGRTTRLCNQCSVLPLYFGLCSQYQNKYVLEIIFYNKESANATKKATKSPAKAPAKATEPNLQPMAAPAAQQKLRQARNSNQAATALKSTGPKKPPLQTSAQKMQPRPLQNPAKKVAANQPQTAAKKPPQPKACSSQKSTGEKKPLRKTSRQENCNQGPLQNRS